MNKNNLLSFYKEKLKNSFKNFNKNNTKFNIDIKKNTNIIQIKIVPSIKKHNEDYCLLFNINLNNKILYDIYLSKCLLLSGTEILNILEKIAKKFKVNEIHLEDASCISFIS